MKIHIDTSTPQDQASAKNKLNQPKTAKKKSTSSGKPPQPGAQQPANQGVPATAQQGAVGAQPQQKPLPKKPPKEPKAPDDVTQARAQQTQVLQARQQREVAGKIAGGPRDVDAGSGFWPPLSPFL